VEHFHVNIHFKNVVVQSRPGYKKDLFANGDDEFSFEEIRAKLPKYRYNPKATVAPVMAQNHQSDVMDMEEDEIDAPTASLLSPLPPQLQTQREQRQQPAPRTRYSQSPTIHTKMAEDEIGAMFSGPIEDEDNTFEKKKSTRSVPKPVQAPVHAAPVRMILLLN
jgi:hypothetical protein